MSATYPNGGSYTSISIFLGRDLLLAGSICRIGDVSHINIHHDNWIPRSGSLKPLGQVHIPGIMCVSDLMNAHGAAWGRTKVLQIFTPDYAREILQIAIEELGMVDYMAWNYTKSGEFTVKSAYHLRSTCK